MEAPGEKPIRLGIQIEKPQHQSVHGLLYFFLIVSFLFVLCTIWLLTLEYFERPLPTWMQGFLSSMLLG